MVRNRRIRIEGKRRRGGFTLLEVVVALGLSLVVVGAIVAFQSYQLTTLTSQAKQVDIQGTTRSIVDLVARELRRAGRNPDCQQAIGGLVTAEQTELRLQTDLDGNGSINGPGEDVTYRWNEASGALERQDASQPGAAEKLVENVDLEGSGLHYFDGNGTELVPGTGGLDAAQRSQVRRIRLDLAITDASARAGESPARARASTNIDLRNRFFVAQNILCTQTVVPPTLPSTPPSGATPTPPSGATPTPPSGATPTQPSGPTPTQPPAVTPTPQPAPTCVPFGGSCTSSSQCCSPNTCQSNNKCK